MTSSLTSSEKRRFCAIIWDDLFIYEARLKLGFIFQSFQNARHFDLATNFLPEIILEVEYTRNIGMSISDILSF